MEHLSPESAKSLKDAGYPQPQFSIGQIWAIKSEILYTRNPDYPESCFFFGENGVRFLDRKYVLENGAYSPTVSELLKSIGDGVVLKHFDGIFECYLDMGDGLEDVLAHWDSAIECAALAWIRKNTP